MNSQSDKKTPIALLAAASAGIAFGCMGTGSQLMARQGFGLTEIAASQFIVAALVMGVLSLAKFRNFPDRSSCVKLLGIERREGLGTVLRVAGADLMDGTPIYDIKPYIPYADCHPEASGGFAPDSGARLTVEYAAGVQERVSEDKRAALTGVLANDPRPRYQHDSSRVYALEFAGLEVKFTVDGNVLTVISAEKKGSLYVGNDQQQR